jgi:hypothetical protein
MSSISSNAPVCDSSPPGRSSHDQFLLALGRATMAAARASGVAFDLLLALGATDCAAMYDDPLAMLERHLRRMSTQRPHLSELSEFLTELRGARKTRDDLLNALPAHNGLQRRRSRNMRSFRTFASAADLEAAAQQLDSIAIEGQFVLHREHAAEVRRWRGGV